MKVFSSGQILDFVPQLRCGRKCLQGIAYYEWSKRSYFSREHGVAKEPPCYGSNNSLDALFPLILAVPLLKRGSAGSEKVFQLALLTGFDYVACI